MRFRSNVVVTATVEFDRELCFGTVEIENVDIERMLASEFPVLKLSIPEMALQNTFIARGVLS
jgi:hypothetical protein